MTATIEEVVAQIATMRNAGKVSGGTGRIGAGYAVDPLTARSLLYSALRWDLAHGTEAMSASLAIESTESFFRCFANEEIRCFTNTTIVPKKADDGIEVNGQLYRRVTMGSWYPATLATFDTGIVIETPHRSGYCWVEDED